MAISQAHLVLGIKVSDTQRRELPAVPGEHDGAVDTYVTPQPKRFPRYTHRDLWQNAWLNPR
jgi:hypothetical protein